MEQGLINFMSCLLISVHFSPKLVPIIGIFFPHFLVGLEWFSLIIYVYFELVIILFLLFHR